jgi:hypothetical protein
MNEHARAATIVVSALALAGCGGLADWDHARPLGVARGGPAVEMASAFLLSADESEDIGGIDTATLAPPPRLDGAAKKTLGIGIRGGAIVPAAAELAAFEPGTIVGAYWRPPVSIGKLGIELEVAVSQNESAGGYESSTLMRAGASALLYLRRRGALDLYTLGGASLLSEQTEDEDLGAETATGASVDIGLGATVGRRVDARVTYSMLVGSENVSGIAGGSLGYAF